MALQRFLLYSRGPKILNPCIRFQFPAVYPPGHMKFNTPCLFLDAPSGYGSKLALIFVLLTGLATPGFAHSPDAAGTGFTDGFAHPLGGWDHLLAMLAVGMWAAGNTGRRRWVLPAMFAGFMAVGGIAGATGITLPLAEPLVLLSVLFFGGLVCGRLNVKPDIALALTALFAFCHGLVHGVEMPASSSLVSFGLGFLAATVILNGLGFATMRAAAALATILAGSTDKLQAAPADPAEPAAGAPAEPSEIFPTTVVRGRADSLVGIASSASEGVVGATQLEIRPLARPGELMETVPGVIVTQHAGGGKANQYFLRGFNLDHGTDFATSLDGMPLNLPTHGHGQGYTDMNPVIPELVERIGYQKGVYDAANGDFASAGSAHLESFRVLPNGIATLEGGMFGYGRAVFADSPRLGDGNLLWGVELFHHDGPWKNPDDFQKLNAIVSYSQGDESRGYSITVRAYKGRWDSSDQVASGAVADGLVDQFSSLDDTTGGDSQRHSLQAEWHRQDASSSTQLRAFGFYYDLDLFSNFTYFLTDTTLGDQFEQVDQRGAGGIQAVHTFHHEWFGREVDNSFGFQWRVDGIQNGLYNTRARQRMDKINADDGSLIPAIAREDEVLQNSVGIFYENRIRWGEKFRSVAGIRGDLYHHDVTSNRAENSGDSTDAISSPKLSLIFGPWAKTEFFLQGGLGFHSNDGRGTTTTVDPLTGANVDADGNSIRPADPLVQTYGAEVGMRKTAVPGLHSTVSLWWLDIDSELLFVGDAGATEASRPSRRYGVEWANYYTLGRGWILDADFSMSHARFRDDAPEGRHIPGAIDAVVAAGLTYTSDTGLFGGVRLRFFGPRPLIEDNSERSDSTTLLGIHAGYRFNRTWTLTAEVFNVLDRRDHDIDYYYESRVRPGDAPISQRHYHPVEPIQARIGLTARF